jgi:NTP pyrophosphatase (non-canonical NTP hydrolase)
MEKIKVILKERPSLIDFQQYVAEIVKQRGFEKEGITEKFMLFTEECGELAKAIRKKTKIKSDTKSKEENISHEVADVFMYLLEICNYFEIDLEDAFRQKEAINNTRTWK